MWELGELMGGSVVEVGVVDVVGVGRGGVQPLAGGHTWQGNGPRALSLRRDGRGLPGWDNRRWDIRPWDNRR